MTDFTQLVDLAAERLGGAVLAANDEFFAPKENLLKPAKPIFIEEKYTDRGKWMDGWETRRRRTPGHDWCIIRLALPGVIRGVVVDTSFFRGNFPSRCSLEACTFDGAAAAEQLAAPDAPWTELLPKSELRGDMHNVFAIANRRRFTHLRFNIFPDGGVARLRVHGEVVPDWRQILAAGSMPNLAAVEHGARPLACSDRFFSAPQNLLMPYPAANMGDGWETKRRRGPGHDWAVLQLGMAGTLQRVEVDTTHFKGNYPESCSLEGCSLEAGPADAHASWPWKEILPRSPLGPDRQHRFEKELVAAGPVTHVRFNIYPDGGVSRLRLFGTPSREGRLSAGLGWLNSLDDDVAAAALKNCCGSARWARAMLDALPVCSVLQFFQKAEEVFASLAREDWLEAFRHHPRIGEKKAAEAQSAQAQSWSAQEQAGVHNAASGTLAALAEANRAYEARFGYIYLVCATGKSSDDLLALLRARLQNDPERELSIAAGEQQKITRLRLEKLLEP